MRKTHGKNVSTYYTTTYLQKIDKLRTYIFIYLFIVSNAFLSCKLEQVEESK